MKIKKFRVNCIKWVDTKWSLGSSVRGYASLPPAKAGPRPLPSRPLAGLKTRSDQRCRPHSSHAVWNLQFRTRYRWIYHPDFSAGRAYEIRPYGLHILILKAKKISRLRRRKAKFKKRNQSPFHTSFPFPFLPLPFYFHLNPASNGQKSRKSYRS